MPTAQGPRVPRQAWSFVHDFVKEQPGPAGTGLAAAREVVFLGEFCWIETGVHTEEENPSPHIEVGLPRTLTLLLLWDDKLE